MKPKILVCDDEIGPRLSIKAILHPAYDVHLVESGNAALLSIKETSYDGMFLDFWMPGLAGDKVLEAIRVSHPTLGVIIMTAYGRETAERIAAGGAVGYILKPATAAAVREAAEKAVQWTNSERAKASNSPRP